MRKIWRTKDKRKSFNGLYPTASNIEEDFDNSTLATVQESTVAGLVRPEYDTKTVKNSWSNVIVNTKDNEINDSSLRLFRAELKGSHLYLYRSLGYKSFRVGDQKDGDSASINSVPPSSNVSLSGPTLGGMSISNGIDANSAISGPINVSGPGIANHNNTNSSIITGSTSIAGSNSGIISNHTLEPISDGSGGAKSPSLAPESEPTIDSLTFTTTNPGLKYDSSTNVFLQGNTTNSLVHFFLFQYEFQHDHNIQQLLTLFPVLPDLATTFKLIDLYLNNLSKFQGEPQIDVITTRVLGLLDNIHDNFKGFSLKSDIAPHILQVLETLTSVSDSKDLLQSFKDKMLIHQQDLLNLVSETNDLNPLHDLGANYFLNHINVVEFASAINAIDLKYYQYWNSNIDKSFLLYSTIRGNNEFYKKNPLFFNNEFHVHYLARLFINQMFNETTINSFNSSSSLLEFKARLIEKWIDLGCVLDKSGNMSGWLGIASIILSQPVLRISKVWSFVSTDYIKLLKNDWSPVLFELDRRFLANGLLAPNVEEDHSFHIMAPRGMGKIYSKEKVVPYFGDLIINNQISNINDLETTYKRVTYSFKRWNEYLDGLVDYKEIIKYNYDVLKRYDSMGFIFSNESLNQVLYLGDSKPLQPIEPSTQVSSKFKNQLFKLIEINADSLDLEKIMALSLTFQPELPEAYLKTGPVFNGQHMKSNVSVNSADSASSNGETGTNIPGFNNSYFKIDLAKYDELANSSDEKHNITIDSELTFRIDDFVDLDSTFVANGLDEVEEDDDEDVPGLGINVDDILNSEKFNVSSNQASPKAQTRSSVISGDSSQNQTYKYIPKLANVNKLIDLLLIDSKYLDASINIDLTEYRFVFLLNYSSFITTGQLLEALAHRFINSGNAVISIMKKLYLKQEGDFPNWEMDTSVELQELGDVDYSILLKIQINILKVLVVLVNNFYDHVSSDLANKKILIKLLKLYSNEILQWYNSNKLDSLEQSFESLVNYYKKLKKLFVRKTYRPIEVSKFDEFVIHEFKFSNTLHEVPINRNLPGFKNVSKIEKFLHKFNKLLTVFYKGIRTEDWFNVYKILEVEYENNNLMEFNLQRPANEDTLIVSNIFTYFDSLNDGGTLVIKKFPLVFRKLFKLYNKFRTYILIQLTDLNITVEERLDRMKTLLYMVKVCQLKFEDYQFVFEGTKGPIPSCIESAITNVIYSPESRLFSTLWVKASTTINGGEDVSYDHLDSLLPQKLTVKDLALNEPLLPCFGWIIENLLDINKCPNFASNLINFNKRYLVYKLIKELTIEDVDHESLTHNDTREFEFLLKLDSSLINYYNIREFTFMERGKVKLFKTVLREQNRILVADNRKRQKDPVVPQITKKPSNPNLKRQSLTYKTNSSSRFKISGFFNKKLEVISVRELPPPDSDPKVKPLVVIPLKNMKIFPVYLLPLSFKIDSDQGDDYLFQAMDESDLNDWLMKLNYANRHWFYSRTLNKSTNSLTFGIPISVVCARQGTVVPKFLMDIFQEIEGEGIKDVGVYRISTSITELTNLKLTIDRTGSIDLSKGYNIHALTSCVKSYFRELPDALLPDPVIESCLKLRQQLINDSTIEADKEFKNIFKLLPEINYETLKALILHLTKVCEHSEVNLMTPANIATVIGPALTEASNLEILINNFGFMNFILEKVIVNYKTIFESKE